MAFATAADAADAIRRRRVSARELLDLTLERIDRCNPRLNAITWLHRKQALTRARQSDEALARGDAHGALHGVPVTIDESFAYRGSPNASGLPPLENMISPRTSAAIARVESAGAIVVGKTSAPALLGDVNYNVIRGTTDNPWDAARTPGGTTAGGAAAVAAGMSYLSIDSDLIGSIGIPARFCGVYGHKPTIGLVSMDGFQPGPGDDSPGHPMDRAAAPLARDAADLALALTVLGGPSGDAGKAWTWRMPAPRHIRLRNFRIGYILGDATPDASDVRSVYEQTISRLGRTGARMERGWPPGIDPAAQANTLQHPRRLVETRCRLACQMTWQQYFRSHDVFLLPTPVTPALPHGPGEPTDHRVVDTPGAGRRDVEDITYWTSSVSLAGLPATVAPIGDTGAGLPVGIQIIAPMWEDGTAIEFAALLSDLIGGFTVPSAFRD